MLKTVMTRCRSAWVVASFAVALMMSLLCSFAIAQQNAASIATGNPVLMLDTGGHMAIIKALAFTRDGRQIVSAGNDKVIRVWDWRSGKTIRTIRGEVGPGEGEIYAIALSPDGRWLAAGGFIEHDVIRIYDFASGRLVRLLRGHADAVYGLAFAPDSRRLISGSADKTAILWDVESGQMLRRLQGHAAAIEAVDFSADGARIVTASDDHSLRLWRTNDGGLMQQMEGHSEGVRSLAIRRSDGLIASGDDAGEIRLWDGATGRPVRMLARQPRAAVRVVFDAGGTRLLSTSGTRGSGSNAQHVWDVATGKELVTYTAHDNIVVAADVSHDGVLAATGGGDKNEIHVWELASGRRVDGSDGRPIALTGTGAPVWAAGFSSDSRRIAWGNVWRRAPGGTGHSSETGSALAFELRLPDVGASLPAPEPLAATAAADFVRGSAIRGNLSLVHRVGGRYGFEDAVLDVVRNGRVIASLERDASSGYRHRAYALSSDGRTIVSAGANGDLQSFDVAAIEAAARGGTISGAALKMLAHPFVGHESNVWAVTPSPDGRYLLSGSADQTVRLWNLKTQELIVTLFRGSDGAWAMWTPQGYYAASPNGETLVGWNLNRGADKEAQWVTAEQLRASFYRPDVVARAIALASAQAAFKEAGLSLTAAEALKSKSLPVIRNVLWPPAGTSVSGGKGIIAIAVEKSAAPPTTWQFKVGGFDDTVADITVAARPVSPPAGLASIAHDEELYAFELPLRQGQNIVKFFATNANGDSQKWQYPIFHDGDGDLDERGTLHILAIGVDAYPGAAPLSDLAFAGRDAKEFAETAAQAMKGRNKDADVVTLCQVPGCSAPPTRAKILAALEQIAKAGERDTVVVFLAGHGESAGGKYFFLPTDFKRAGTDVRSGANALDWDLVEDALGRARGSKLLFTDACHSGAAFNDKLLNDARQQGVIAFSSAASNEVAWEDPEVKHGLFTYWLIRGLNGEAEDSNHTVTVYRLGNFLAEKVPEYTARRNLSRQDPLFAALSNPAIAWR